VPHRYEIRLPEGILLLEHRDWMGAIRRRLPSGVARATGTLARRLACGEAVLDGTADTGRERHRLPGVSGLLPGVVVLGDVLVGCVDEEPDVIVDDAVVRVSTLPSDADDLIGAQEAQRVRHRGFVHHDARGELRHAELTTIVEGEQQAQPSGIAEKREHIGHQADVVDAVILELPLWWQGVPPLTLKCVDI
jgi:hypothetical protein